MVWVAASHQPPPSGGEPFSQSVLGGGGDVLGCGVTPGTAVLVLLLLGWQAVAITSTIANSGLDGFWCILSFDTIILTHPGVFFATTNNIYTGVKRGTGAENLERLFAEKVVRWEGNVVARHPNLPRNQATCEQAEVLYPGELSLDYLKTVYVKSDEDAYSVESLIKTLDGVAEIDCVVQGELFE